MASATLSSCRVNGQSLSGQLHAGIGQVCSNSTEEAATGGTMNDEAAGPPAINIFSFGNSLRYGHDRVFGPELHLRDDPIPEMECS